MKTQQNSKINGQTGDAASPVIPGSLTARLFEIDGREARRFAKLTAPQRRIAWEGIRRHFVACSRIEIDPDASAIREIIDDAVCGRRVFASASDDARLSA